MAKFKVTIRKNRLNSEGKTPVLVSVSVDSKSAYIQTPFMVNPNEWNNDHLEGKQYVGINKNIELFFNQVTFKYNELLLAGKTKGLNAIELKNILTPDFDPEKADAKRREKTRVRYRLLHFMDLHKTAGTRAIYQRTLDELEKFDSNFASRGFEDINKEYLIKFEKFLEKSNKTNTISIYMRSLRACFNDAIDDDITNAYPFRKFKIKSAPTEKRSLEVDDLREIFNAEIEDWQKEWIDLFKLIFMLRGINLADLYNLKEVSGYLVYDRAKTHKRYTIKLEPEMQVIISKWKGKEHILSVCDRYATPHDIGKHMDNAIRTITAPLVDNGSKERTGRNCGCLKKDLTKSKFAKVTSYWARHSYASIAYNDCEIPADTVSLLLGHSGVINDTTAIYIKIDQKRIDEANRKVIDFVLYNKKGTTQKE